MNEKKMREEFEYYRRAWGIWQAACASRQKEIDALNEYINHTLNAVDNLNDMPISKDWAKNWVNKAFNLLEKNDYFRCVLSNTREEKPPVEPEEVYSPHTEVLK